MFAEDANIQKVQRTFRRFLQPNSEFIKEYQNLIVHFVKNSFLLDLNQQLIILLSELINNKKVGNVSIIKNISDKILPEVLSNPTNDNFELLTLFMKDSTISEQMGKEQRLEFLYNMIVGFGKISIDSVNTTFEQLLQKIHAIFKVYSENMNLKNFEKGSQEFKFLDHLFEVSYQFMSNMKKIQEDELHKNQQRKMESELNTSDKQMEVEVSLQIPPPPVLNLENNSSSKKSQQIMQKSLNSDSSLDDSYVDERSESESSQNQFSRQQTYSTHMENLMMKIQSSIKKELTQKSGEDTNKSIQPSKSTTDCSEDLLQKQFELIAKISSYLFTIYKALGDIDFLNKRMSSGLNYDVLSKLIVQINSFYVHHRQISTQLTKIILLFINSNTLFTEDFVKSYCSQLSHFLLRYKADKSNSQINNHVISVYVKIYLSLTAQKKEQYKEDIEIVNKNILEFFLEGLFEVKNYHMLLLNLVYMNLNNPAEKEKMVKSVLGSITVMNQNIMILILLLYNLLVNSSYNIFENKFKSILMNLLQQKPVSQTSSTDEQSQNSGNSSSNGIQNAQNSNNSDQNNQGMIDMSDPLNINSFLSINNQNVKKMKLPSISGQSSSTIMSSSISLQLSADTRLQLINLIKKLNTNITQVQQNVNNLQVFFSLMIELNQIAQMMDNSFQKSLLITNFEQIQQINAVKNYEGAITLFNESIALDNMSQRDSQIFALLLRTNHLIRSNETSSSNPSSNRRFQSSVSNTDKMEIESSSQSSSIVAGSENTNKSQQNQQDANQTNSNKMIIEEDSQEIIIIHQAITKAVERLKLYSRNSQEQLRQVVNSIMIDSQSIEREIMMCILKQDSLKSIDIFDKLNLQEALYVDILKFIMINCNSAIENEIQIIIEHLKKNLNAVYITELLSIISQPLKYLDKDISSRFTQAHSKIQQDLNSYIFSRMYVKELHSFIDVLFTYVNKHSSGKLKEFYNFDKYPTSKILCEEVMLQSVLNANVVSKSNSESFDSLFNSQVQKFSEYFKSNTCSTFQEHEKLAFLIILNKFQKYSLQVELFNVILIAPQISDFSMSVLNQIILLVLAEIKSSPLYLKAFCIAFNLYSIPKESVDSHLLLLCYELRRNLELKGSTLTSSNNILLDILLRYPNRHADLLLPFIGQKGVNLKEKIWFPISDLIKTCFYSSDVEMLYDLDVDHESLQGGNNKSKTKSKMEKALISLKKESARGQNKDLKIIQAFERMTTEQFMKFDSEVQKCSYEIYKNLYYSTENIANFKTLRLTFTQNFLTHFNTVLTINRSLIQSFIRDCEITPSKITLSESDEKNKVMKICFAELMNFFEAIIKESKDFDKTYVKQVLLLASEIVYTITKETYNMKNYDAGIIGYNNERIIQVAHFIFTNSLNFIDIKDHYDLIKELFNYGIFLSKLDCPKAKKCYVEILLLLILHIKQAEQEQYIAEKKKRGLMVAENVIKDNQQQQQQQQQMKSNDKMEAEQTREQLIEELDKKFNNIPKEITSAICTLEKNQGRQEQQVFYKCHTCNIADSNFVICSWCAYVCHNGHDVIFYRSSSGTCDCVEKGPAGTCKSKLYKKDSIPQAQQPVQSSRGFKFERYENPQQIIRPPIETLISQFENHDIPPDFLNYYLKGKEKEEKLRAANSQEDRGSFNFEKKFGLSAYNMIQDEQDEYNEEMNEEQYIEEEEKNDEEIFSSESDKDFELKQTERNLNMFPGSQRTYMLDKESSNRNKDKNATDYSNLIRFGDLNKFNFNIQRQVQSSSNQQIGLQQDTFVQHNNQFYDPLNSLNINNPGILPQDSISNQNSSSFRNPNNLEFLENNYIDHQKLMSTNASSVNMSKDTSEMDTILQNLIETQQKQSPQFNAINSILKLCEQQLQSTVQNWDQISSNSERQNNDNVVQPIDFCSLMNVTALSSQMDNTLGKIVCRLNKNGMLDMRVRDDQYSENNYFLMQSGYAAQPVAPMIIRKPIDHNNENLIIVSSGSKLLLKLAESIKSQLASSNEEQFLGTKLLQLTQTDISIIQQYPLDYSIMHIRFSPKNPQVVAICGLNQISIWKINQDAKINKSINIPQKNYGEYINKILWLPNSESVRLFQVNFEGNSPLIMKFNANDQSGIFKDFVIAENPSRQNVACADGRVYYQDFGTQQREDIILTTYISVPTEFVPKGQVCMGISYSPYSNIFSLSYKNGVNIFGKLDLKTHKLSNCFTYRPLQSQNKNGLLSFIEKSGEIMANTNELHVDDNQCIYVTALRDPNNQVNYSIHSGYLTVIKLSPNSIVTQPLATSLVKVNEDKKCEGYCFIKSEKLEGVKLVMSVHEDGTLNLFGIQNDGQNVHNIHKYIREQLIVDPKEKKKSKQNGESANEDDEDGESYLKYLSDEDQDESAPGDKKSQTNHPFASDPTYRILKNEFKLSDLTKSPTLIVDFMEKYQPLKQDADIKLELNKTRQDSLLNNEKNQVLISKNDPQEITLKCQNKQNIITGVRIRMQMPANTGQGIYKIKLFNREVKLLNTTQDDKKVVDLSFSNLEIVYAYLQNSLTFTLSSSNPISNSMKIASHDIKLISIEPYGCNISLFQLKEKLEQLKQGLKIKTLSNKQETKPEEKENPLEVQSILANSQRIIPIDFLKRRVHLQGNIQSSEVRDLMNELDLLTIQILLNQQQLNLKNISENLLNATRLKEFAKKLKILLVNPKINGEINSYLLSSVKRTLKCILSAYQVYSAERIIVSHPMEYTTFKTLARTEYFYNKLNEDICTLSDIYKFLQSLEKLAFNRLPLLFMIYAIYPQIIHKIIKKFLTIIKGDYEQKICEQTINSILKTIILYYQFLKNKAVSNISAFYLEEILKNESLKDAGKEAFDLFEQFLIGLQSSNLRQKLMNPAREFQIYLKNESQIYKEEVQRGQIRKFEFAFDLFSYKPKQKCESEINKIVEKKDQKQATNVNSYRQYVEDDMEDISEQQDIDMQMAYGYNGDIDQLGVGGANNLMFAGIDNMNEEEMMKLAIEMSLQEKNNIQVNDDVSESNSQAQQAEGSNSKRMEEENPHASGDDSESMRIRNVEDEEKKSVTKLVNLQKIIKIFLKIKIQMNEEEQDEIIKSNKDKPKDMIDESEENNEDELIQINPQKISILTFDISSDFLTQLLNKLINCNKQPIGNEILLVYLFLISYTLKISSCQSSQIAYELANAFYQLINLVNNNTLTNQNSEEAKVLIVALKILCEVIKTPTSSDSKTAIIQKDQSTTNSQQGVQEQSQTSLNPQLVGSSSTTSSDPNKIKESTKKQSKQVNETYKNLREEFKKQYKIYEEKNKISFTEKIYDNFKLMLKHFEGSRSSLKIEYANGEVVQVVSKVNLKPSTTEILQQCFKHIEEFNQKLPQLMQIADQIQFGNLMSLLYYLLQMEKGVMDQKNLQKWSILLSEILVSPTTSFIYSSRTERILQLLMKTTQNYYDIRDRIGLHKDFEIAQRIYNSSKQFKDINYDQLLVIVQSLQKILKIAQERRQNWLKFCNSKSDVIKILYDAVLNNVKGCIEPSLKLISLYYGTEKK